MKKLSFVLLLSMLLALAVPCFAAGAEEPAYAADTVAVIGETEYSDLQDAFDAVRSGETILLVRDLTDSKKTYTYSGAGFVKGETVVREKVTFDGNGHSIVYKGGTGEANFALVFDTNAVIEVRNLTLLSIRSAIRLTDGAQVFLRDCNLCAANTDYRSDAYDLKANKDFKGSIIKIDNDYRSFVEINGGSYYGAASTGIDVRYGSIVIRSGKFRIWNAEVLLQVGDNTADAGADKVRASGTILGGSFEASDYTAKTAKLIRAYKSAAVTIWGGDFLQRSEGTKSGGSTVLAGATSSSFGYLYIHGGNFYQLSSQPAAKLIGNNDLNGKNNIPSAGDKVFAYVTGGTFYSKVVEGRNTDDMTRADGVLRYDDTVAKITAATAEYKGEQMTQYTVAYQYTEAAPMPDAAAKVVNPDGTVYYTASLWEALNPFAQDGATVTLLSDTALDRTLYLNNRYFSLTLDGNGKTLASTAPNAVNVQTGSVTVRNLTVRNANGSAFRVGYLPAAEEILSGASYTAALTLKNVTVNAKELIAAAEKELLSGKAILESVSLNGAAVPDETRVLPVADQPAPPEPTPSETDTDAPEKPSEPAGSEENKPGDTGSKEPETSAAEKPDGGCSSALTGSALLLLLGAAGACAGFRRRKED